MNILQRGVFMQEQKKPDGPRVHLHTTVSATTKSLLNELAGDTGRINECLEEAVRYYSKRRGVPDCDECSEKRMSRMRDSLIQSADMVMVSSQFLAVLASCAIGLSSARDILSSARRIGLQQAKLLMGIGTIPENTWSNSYDSLVKNAQLLESVGALVSVETHPERSTVLLTTGMLAGFPELLLAMLLGIWDQTGFTVDAEVVGDNKISLKWLTDREFASVREERDRRIADLWRERRERLMLQKGTGSGVVASPALMDWLITHRFEDVISEKTLISIREFAQSDEAFEKARTVESVHERVARIVAMVGSSNIWESSGVMQDGELIRVQMRCRSTPLKDLALKLVRSLLALEGIEEITREEGVATAVAYFGEVRHIGRK